MKKYNILLFCITILTTPWIAAATASDLAKEERWAEQINASLMTGESVQLKAGDSAFLGLYTEASQGPGTRAAIVVHGMGAHPDWPDVIYPLRSELPELGWSTLSIQMPVLGNEAPVKDYLPLFEEVAPRMNSAINYLRERGNKTIVVVAHSLGASMATRFVADNPSAGIDGLVIIGMSVIDIDTRMNGALALEKISIPVLDLYGSRDLDTVLATRETRASSARKAGNPGYQQYYIEGADHFFTGVQDELVRRVYGWLKRHFETGTGDAS